MSPILIPLLIIAIPACIVYVFGRSLLPVFMNGLLHRALLRKGIQANAIILSVSQTGLYLNKKPLMKVEVQVHPNMGRSFIAEARHVLDFGQIPQFRCGRSVQVKYDPANPRRVVLCRHVLVH